MSRSTITKVIAVAGLWLVGSPQLVGAQQPTPETSGATEDAVQVPIADDDSVSVVSTEESARLPVYLMVGGGYGQRQDECALCESLLDTESFTGHAGIGKFLTGGLAVGLDLSVWQKSRNRAPELVDSTAAVPLDKIASSLGNASLSFSYQVWHVYVRAGGGLAWGRQDLELADLETGEVTVRQASGMGLGYSVGGGLTLPLFSVVSLAFFGNWNVGLYDLRSDGALLVHGARHEYVEAGIGLTIR